MAGAQPAQSAAQPMPADPSQQAPADPNQPPADPSQSQPDQNDPNFIQALKFAMSALYESGAAQDVAKSLKSSNDIVESLANTAYEMTAMTDEKTEGRVPDELLILLATNILEEVADIAQAAGIKIKPSDVALAFKQMLLRYLGENGVDTSQLQQAMDQIDPEEFNRAAGHNEAAEPNDQNDPNEAKEGEVA